MAVEHIDMSEKLKDGYQSLMLSYAAGALDEAQSLIVSAHVSLSASARQILQNYEMVGGALLEQECRPVAMSADSLDCVLGKLDTRTCHEPAQEHSMKDFPDDIHVPDVLKRTLAQQKSKPRWKSLYPGLRTFELDLNCKTSQTRFLKAVPSLKTPHHSHGGIEITLVLDGAFEDETGRYSTGDMIVTDEDCHHTPVACSYDGCVCMVVSSDPIKLTGIAKLLNPFIRV